MGVVEIVHSVALVQTHQLQVAVSFGLALEVEDTPFVALIPVIEGYSMPMLIVNLLHGETVQAQDLKRVVASLVGTGKDKHIAKKHPVDFLNHALDGCSALKGPFHLPQENRLGVAVAPDVGVEGGVVALKELGVALDPLVEQLESETE